MVDSVTDERELLVIPREKKKNFVELVIPFLLGGFYSSKQIWHGYRSLSIAYMLQGTS